jgi:hypothetical protein
MARTKMELHQIATYAGHKSLTSTMLYIHLSGVELTEAVTRSLAGFEQWIQLILERRSSNEVDRKSEAWLAQENPSDKEKEHATSALATCSGVVRARRTDRETDSESQIIRVSAKAAARTPG